MMNQSILIQNVQRVPHPSAKQWLRRAAPRLPLDQPEQEARALLLAVLGRSLSWYYTHGDQPLTPAELTRLERALERRRDGQPLAYIIGYKAFWDMELTVSPAVLCPRPETELLVEASLECLAGTDQPTIADLGTGSGAIALALARERPDARVLGTDLSSAALEVAVANGRQWAPQVRWLQTRWLEGLCGPFHLIVTNPPYIDAHDPWLGSDGTRHEPKGALVAGEGGLADLLAIIRQAPSRLLPAGWLVLEHGHEQGEPLRARLKKAGFQQVETRRDLAGLPRVTLGRRPAQVVQSRS